MMRLSKMTDYAVVMMVHMGQRPQDAASADDAIFTAARMADDTGVPQPTAAKLLKMLGRAGLLTSERGAQGGYRLARASEDITVAEIIQAMEGPIALTACVDGTDESCNVESLCGMRGNWNRVNEAIRSALDRVTLADMALQPMQFPADVSLPAAGSATRRDRTLNPTGA